MNEQDVPALAELDRRARAAAAALRRSIDTLVTDDHPVAAAPGSADTSEAPAPTAPATIPVTELPGPPGPAVIRLDEPTGDGRRRGARRWSLAAAAVAVVAAVGGAVAVVTTDDDGQEVRGRGSLDYLVPGRLPAGLEPVRAIDIPGTTATAGFDADIAVYGDPDADDPWAAIIGVIHLVADEELLGGPPSGGEAVTVAGHDARLRESEGLGPTETGPAWEVEWEVDDGRLIVSGALTRDEVLAAAEKATTEPAIDTSGLPGGYEELARGPFVDSLLFTSLFEGNLDGSVEASVDGSGLAVTYADPSDRNAVRTAVVVAQRPGPASAVDLLRLWFPDTDVTTVRGRHAAIGRGRELPGSAGETGVVAVQWAEPEGQLVTVVGFGVVEDVVLQVAEGLRPASPDEVAALRAEQAVAAPREFDDVPEGHVVVASGESQTGQWRIVANARRRENIGSLTIDRVWGAISSTTSTTGDRVEPPLDLAADIADGTIVVWGLLWVDAASVTVEGPGGEPIALDIHEVEGWSHRVVADAFPKDHFAYSGGPIEFVAWDADGREVGRNSTVLSPDG
jgi:hypothetical protein